MLGLIFGVNTASAAVIVSQSDDSVFEIGSSGYGQSLGAGLSGDLMFIKIKYDSPCTDLYSGDPFRVIQLYEGSSVIASFGGFEKDGDFCTFKRMDNSTNFTDTSLALLGGSSYHFIVMQNGPNQGYGFFGSSDADSYPSGNIIRYYSGGWNEGSGVLKDLYFELMGPNEEPIISSLSQRISQIEEGSGSSGSGVFGALAISQLDNDMRLQVEVKVFDAPFTGDEDGLIEGGFGQSGARVEAEVSNLLEGQYHWRARAIDTEGNMSEWVEYDSGNEADFNIEIIPAVPGSTFLRQLDYSSSETKNTPIGQYLGSNLSGDLLYIAVKYDSPCIDEGNYHEPHRRITLYDGASDVDYYAGFEQQGNLCIFKRFVSGEFLDTPFTLIDGHSYVFVVGQNGPAEAHTFFGSDDANSYSNGNVIRSYNSGWSEDVGKLKDLYFELRGPEQDLTPVIIVPGIMGSRLNRVSGDQGEVWPNGGSMFLSRTDDYLDELILDESGYEQDGQDISPTAVIDSVLLHTAYGDLVNNFFDQGYVLGTTLFTIPYDWRLDLSGEVDRLTTAVQDAISNSQSGKVNIIAHSMGGLLVKEYLNNLPDTSFVNKLVIAGVPQLGAPKAFKAIMYGDNMGFDLFGADILNPERIRIISRDMPGVYELLPTERYVNVSGGYVQDFRSGGSQILNHEDTKIFLEDNDKNTTLLTRTNDFHADLDGEPFNAQSVYNIVGCRNPNTIGMFRLYDDKIEISPVDGDGTVPLTSSFNLSSNYTNYFALDLILNDMNHMDLVRRNEPIELINDIINDQAADLPLNISTSLADCLDRHLVEPDIDSHDVAKTLYISTHSPVKLHVYDLDGNHVGPNADGDIDLEIPDSDYETIGHNNFAILPAGNYEIVVDATDSGEFDLEIETYTDLVPENKIVYIDIPVDSENSIASVNYTGPTGDLTLGLDNDGDLTIDEEIQPNAVLDENTAGDITPPEISFNMQAEVIVNSQVVMDFTVTDDLSGVEVIEADLDGTPVSTGDSVLVSEIGEHTLTVKAVDGAGNPRTTEFSFNAIYGSGGFLPPINADGSGIYKLRRTIPIKFQLTDANDQFISTANPALTIKKISSEILGEEIVELPIIYANADDTFRYDAISNQYIYNLSTKTITVGTWQLSVTIRYDAISNQYIYNLSTKTITVGTWQLSVTIDDGRIYEIDASITK